MESFIPMKFIVITGNSHKHMSFYPQRMEGGCTFLSLKVLSLSFWSMTRFPKAYFWVSTSFPIQLSAVWQFDLFPSRLPSSPLNSFHRGPCLTLKAFVIVHHSFISRVFFSSWLSLTAPSPEFPQPLSLSLTSLFSVLNANLHSGSFLGCGLSYLNTPYLFSLDYLRF